MPRIRTIKPEFWTSESITECSPVARLLFIGLWNFADDAGRHKVSPLRLKMEVFPGDSFSRDDIESMIGELIENDLLFEYEVDDESYWQIKGWHHQRIDQPNIRFPGPDGEIIQPEKRLGGKQRQRVMDRLIKRDSRKCQNCGNTHHLTIDHIKPRSAGGTNDMGNLQLLCKRCNSEKSDKVREGDAPVTREGDAQVTREVHGSDSPPEGNRREGKGREKIVKHSLSDSVEPCVLKAFVEKWNQQSPLSGVASLRWPIRPARRDKLAARLQVSDWESLVFKAMRTKLPIPDCEWLDFDWMVKNGDNVHSLLNGKYDFKLPPTEKKKTEIDPYEYNEALEG